MNSDGVADVPASIEIAWGLRERPTKGPQPGLSLERIVEAAVRIAATDGLGAVSMNRVAADLGVGTMSLYRYVGAKEELLVLMSETAYAEDPAPLDPDQDWRGNLERWAWQLFDVSRRNSWVLRIPISGPPATPNQLVWLEVGLAALREAALSESEKISVMMLLTGYVRSEATLSVEMGAAFAAAGATEQDASSAYGRLIMRLITPEQFPAIAAVMTAGVPDEGATPETRFRFGLDRLLDGVAALVRTKR